MLSDGANAFTWNARNQLAALNGRNLQYDANGRRIQNLLGTSFLYDADNIAQELSGSTVTANLVSGGIDETFSRTDSSGAFTQLKDALGSTIALVDASGNVQATYTYDPFGNTSVSGASNTNVYQYTGRENEGNGLYFYRARYYSPLLGRFISEDPLGFAGSGSNFYAYVGNDPISYRDPTGLARDCFFSSCGGVPATGNGQNYLARGDTFSPRHCGLPLSDDLWCDGLNRPLQCAHGPCQVGLVSSNGIIFAGVGLASGVAGGLADGAAEEAAEDAAADATEAAVDPNKLSHIFDNAAHNLEPVVNTLGGQAEAFNALQSAVQAQGLPNGLFSTVVNVGGANVTVTGLVINGTAKIGTAFIP